MASNAEQTYNQLNKFPLVDNSVAPTFLQFTTSFASRKFKQRARILLGSLCRVVAFSSDGRVMVISAARGLLELKRVARR